VIRLQERLKFRLIHFSSSEVYGDWPDLMVETVMDEIKQMNDYAMTKWVNEMIVANGCIYPHKLTGGSFQPKRLGREVW
jgi:dTDP-glucose 4,6-dehydratase